MCCTQVAETKLVKHMQHGCCWQVLVPVGHEQLRHGPSLVHLAQASSLDMLVLVGEVSMQAGLHTIHILLHEASWCTWSSSWPTCSTSGERPPQDLSIMVCGSSAQAPSCWRERRRQLSCADAAGGLAEWPRA